MLYNVRLYLYNYNGKLIRGGGGGGVIIINSNIHDEEIIVSIVS